MSAAISSWQRGHARGWDLMAGFSSRCCALSKIRRRQIGTVLADAGYDSHENHRVARTELKVRSLIKAGAGRPSAKPPTSKVSPHDAKKAERIAEKANPTPSVPRLKPSIA